MRTAIHFVPSFRAILVGGNSFCANAIKVYILVLAYVKFLKMHLGYEVYRRAGEYGLDGGKVRV